MFSHVFIGVGDFDLALAFYTPLTAALGPPQRFCDPSGTRGLTPRSPVRSLTRPP